MGYPDELVEELWIQLSECSSEVIVVAGQILAYAEQHPHGSHLHEHLVCGVARRLTILRRSAANVFKAFPPEASGVLDNDLLGDVEINIHAFVINLAAIFDNWAWAYAHRHSIVPMRNGRADRMKVAIFNGKFAEALPQRLLGFLRSNRVIDWHTKYAKEFRDALAHRIPLFVAPAEITSDKVDLYKRLMSEWFDRLKAMDFASIDEIREQMDSCGSPSLTFQHSFVEQVAVRRVYIHTQLVKDLMLAIEVCKNFLQDMESPPSTPTSPSPQTPSTGC